MRRHIKGIDHVVIAVKNLDAAQLAYAQMGFTLTPRGFHSFGSQNHCVMFAGDYLELLAVPSPQSETQVWADFLLDGEGVASLALKTDDVEAAYRELRDDEIVAQAPVTLTRKAATPQGEREASFRLSRLPSEYTPGVSTFLCEHGTRDVIWQTEFLRHRNGARGLRKIVVAAEDAKVAGLLYARLFGTTASAIPQGYAVQTGGVPIVIATAEVADRSYGRSNLASRPLPFVAALHLSVPDLEASERVLRDAGTTYRSLAAGLCVPASGAHGVALVFEA